MTAILRIEHPVSDFVAWREAFDGDPVGREQGGVRRYRIMRDCEDPGFVLIDLEFDASAPAQAFLSKLGELWRRVELMRDPQTRIVELAEERSLLAGGGSA